MDRMGGEGAEEAGGGGGRRLTLHSMRKSLSLSPLLMRAILSDVNFRCGAALTSPVPAPLGLARLVGDPDDEEDSSSAAFFFRGGAGGSSESLLNANHWRNSHVSVTISTSPSPSSTSIPPCPAPPPASKPCFAFRSFCLASGTFGTSQTLAPSPTTMWVTSLLRVLRVCAPS